MPVGLPGPAERSGGNRPVAAAFTSLGLLLPLPRLGRGLLAGLGRLLARLCRLLARLCRLLAGLRGILSGLLRPFLPLVGLSGGLVGSGWFCHDCPLVGLTHIGPGSTV
jgi:hypothetical protein